MIEKINGFWVPSNDIHVKSWKSGSPFTQNKCLTKLIDHCEAKNLQFNHILDIGAWVGTWSMAMNKYCGRILAFEPDPLNYSCLVKNVTGDIETHQLAVGSEDKLISLTKDDFTQSKRVAGDGQIPMITIDSLKIDDIDLLKIDVEGYEMEVLKGAQKSLKNVKYIMIELNNNTKKYGSNNKEIEEYLQKKGFQTLFSHWPDKVFKRK